MDAMMIPMVQAPKTAVKLATRSPADPKGGSDFSAHLEKKLAAARRQESNQLGTSRQVRQAQQGTPQAEQGTPQAQQGMPQAQQDDPASPLPQDNPGNNNEDAASLSILLGQFIQDMQKVAEDKGLSPGQWSFNSQNNGELLQQIAQDAGLNDSQLALLTQQMENQGGKMDLSEFLSFFSRHFETLASDKPVTAPETDLPLLGLLLERVGVPSQEVAKIGDAAVRGDNTLDMEKFLAGLQKIAADTLPQGEKTAVMSPVEADELREMLAAAGVSEPMQRALLPELFPSPEKPFVDNQPLALNLDRLKNLLAHGVNEVKANQLQANLPAFLDDLSEVLVQAGFTDPGNEWNPAIQGAVSELFDKLMESVDLAKVQVSAPQALPEEEFGKNTKDSFAALLDADFEEGEALIAQEGGEAVVRVQSGETDLMRDNPGQERPGAETGGMLFSEAAAGTKAEIGGNQVGAVNQTRPLTPIPNMPHSLQQHSFSQISQGVLQGLRSQEHHLVMKLYPKELGEVRVEMTVRDNQVALSFAMENSKVKEVLEGNLEQFKENMENQGYKIGECIVSLQKDNNAGDSWQRFQETWQEERNLSVSRNQRRTSLADLPEDVFYQRPMGNSSETGLDLFA